MRNTIHYLVALAALVLSACAQPPDITPTSADDSAPALRIDSAWSRSTPEIEAGTGIVYMTIGNNSGQADTLLAAKTPAAAAAEFHIHIQDSNGVMRMRMVDGGRIDIPTGASVVLEPGGLHIMLIDLARPLQAGDTYPLTLKFAKAGEVTLMIPVADEAPTAGGPMDLISGSYETLAIEP